VIKSLSIFISRSRNHAKIAGVTIKMHARLLTMPPMIGAASGFINSAPARLLHKLAIDLRRWLQRSSRLDAIANAHRLSPLAINRRTKFSRRVPHVSLQRLPTNKRTITTITTIYRRAFLNKVLVGIKADLNVARQRLADYKAQTRKQN
jgi:hypothetical protein